MKNRIANHKCYDQSRLHGGKAGEERRRGGGSETQALNKKLNLERHNLGQL